MAGYMFGSRLFISVILLVLCGKSPYTLVSAIDVNVSASSSTSLQVIWENASFATNISVSRYELYYGVSNCSSKNQSDEVDFTQLIVNENETQSLGFSKLSYEISGLKKWSCYQVKISVVLESGGYHGSNTTIAEARTLEDAPTASPQNFTAHNLSSTSLKLSWEPPPTKYTHGFIRYYLIKFQKVRCDNGSAIDASWNYTTAGKNERSKILTNLTFWSCYDIEIAAVTVKEGKFAKIIKRRSSENAPTAPPQNFTVANDSSSSLVLSWIPPLADRRHGLIRYYVIKYRVVGCSDGAARDSYWNTTTVEGDKNSTRIANLLYWTCYHVKIAAFTVKEGPFANVTVRTSENAPTASPQNFTAHNLSSTSLKLSWEPPPTKYTHGFIRYYLIKFQKVRCDNGSAIDASWNYTTAGKNERSKTLTNLTFWSCYDIEIAAVTVGEGKFAKIIKKRSSENAPTAPPQNFTVANDSSSSLILNWIPPLADRRHGLIRKYVIKYRVVGCSDGAARDSYWNTTTVEGDKNSTRIANLLYWTCYHVKIAAFTVKEGPFANVTVRTSENAPTASPQNFTAHNLSSTSLKLSWEPPPTKYTHGFIRYYLIKFQKVRCDNGSAIDGSWNYTTAGKNERSKTLTNLTFWSCYDIEIAAVTVGEGKFAKIIKKRSSENAPTAPPQNFTVANDSSSSLILNWIPPLADRRHGLIRKYVIKYRVVGCSDGAARDSYWNTTTVEGDKNSTRIANLLYWTCYHVKIAAFTVKEGPFANVTVRTSENAPTASPQNFTAHNLSSTSLKLSWEPPPTKYTHGFIRYYLIKFQKVRCDNGSLIDGSWNYTTAGKNERSKTLTNLTFWSCYDIEIAAVTVGEGKFAKIIKKRSSENAPTAPPQNFTVANDSSSSLVLSWIPPLADRRHGLIRKYVIKYRVVGCSDGAARDSYWNTTTVEGDKNSTRIANLLYWTCYHVKIAAFTVKEGPFANVTVRTSENAPTASPQKFTAHNLSSTSLKLSWEPPPTKYTHGFIRYYLIKFQKVRCDNGSAIDASWNYTTAGKNERSKTLTNLTFWSCYDIEIAAVTVGEGKFAKIIKRRSSENAPTAPPQNFTVANDSSSSLVLSWIPPLADRRHGLIRKYMIKYRVVGCSDGAARDSYWNTTTVEGEQRSTRIANLLYWTCYDVKIAAFTVKEGPFANVTVRTSENAPTAKPQSFEVTNTSSSSLQLSWEPPEEKLTHGIIRYYVIKFRVVDCSTGSSDAVWNITTVKSELRNTTIGGLLFWTCYDVKIAAVTVGQGPFASEKKVRTSENAPTAEPQSFKVTNTSSSSLQLKWEPPKEKLTHGIIRYYVIRFRIVDCSTSSSGAAVWNTTTVKSELRNTTIGGLLFWTCYDLQIAAVTVGQGPFASKKKVRTSENAPTAKPQSFEVTNKSSSSLQLKWEPPQEKLTHGIIRYYVIRFRIVDCSTGSSDATIWNITTVKSELRNTTIGGLLFWTCYDVEIAAVTVGQGPFASKKKVRTSENAPTAKPQSFKVTNTSSSSLQLKWEPPEEKLTHGNIRYYVIKFRIVDCSTGSSDAVWNITTVKSELRNTTIGGLLFWTCYDVEIAAVTVGQGPFASKKKVRTSENAPTQPPNLYYLRNSSSTSLLVKWNPPPSDFQHGNIRGYKVFYQTASNCTTTPEPITKTSTPKSPSTSTATPTSTATTTTKRDEAENTGRKRRAVNSQVGLKSTIVYEGLSLNITGLEKWTCYTAYVICWTVDESPRSNPKEARTTEDTPEAPSFDSCKNKSSTEITVKWKEPSKPNGIVLNYRLSWKYVGTLFDSDNRNGEEDFNSKTQENTIGNLRIFSNYTFTLKAKTSIGWGESTSITCATGDSSPTKPLNLKAIVQSAREISISWSPPNYLNGVFRGYEINYTNTKTDKKDEVISMDTSKSFPNLDPYTKYDFSVVCVGSGGRSNPVKISATTKTTNPKTPSGVPPTVTVPVSHTTITVHLQRFSDSHGPIKFYWIIVYNMAGGEPKDPKFYNNSDFKKYEDRKIDLPYISAVLKTIPADGLFTIGDGKKYTNISNARKRRSNSQAGFTNGRLDAEATYKIFQRAFTSDTHYASTNWFGPFKTGATPTEPPTSVAGPVAGTVVALLVIFGLVAGGYFYYKRRHQDTKPKPPIIDIPSPVGTGEVNDGFVNEDFPIPVDQFEAHCQRLFGNGGYQISEQFKVIQNDPNATAEHSRHEINREKNRYNNILAYDHNRVQLHRFDNIPEADYINANYIDGYGKSGAYVATQGPLPNTCEDFWRMVWEQGVTIIVMVTRCEENGRVKCHQYWPLAGSLTFGTMQISVSESNQLPDFNISMLSVLNSREPGKEIFVRHFHFITWPDHGVPSAAPLMAFLRRVNESTPPDSGPIVVHCSAGVGRTGTYIQLDINLKRIKAEKNVDVFNTLKSMRKQRNYLVQTEGQYAFIHEALLEQIKCGYTEILAKDLRDHIKSLQARISNEEIKLDREFQKLNEFAQNNNMKFKSAQMVSNKGKNRFFNILPYDETRVALRVLAGVPGSDYINASYIDGYHEAKAFIATQAPLPNTVDDFWRMIYEQSCTTIVCLIKDSESARTKMHEYWPEEEVRKTGPLLIEKLQDHKQPDFIIRDFKVTNSQRGSSRIVRHFQFIAWPDNGMPENGACLVDFIGQVQKWQQQSGNAKIVVHCSTGVGRTGVFIALVNLIERLKAEGVVNVFQTVRGLRNQRTAMVQTKGQYMFCYIALQDYLASFDIYSNFM